jgi:hypothetical protein
MASLLADDVCDYCTRCLRTADAASLTPTTPPTTADALFVEWRALRLHARGGVLFSRPMDATREEFRNNTPADYHTCPTFLAAATVASKAGGGLLLGPAIFVIPLAEGHTPAGCVVWPLASHSQDRRLIRELVHTATGQLNTVLYVALRALVEANRAGICIPAGGSCTLHLSDTAQQALDPAGTERLGYG